MITNYSLGLKQASIGEDYQKESRRNAICKSGIINRSIRKPDQDIHSQIKFGEFYG